MKRWSLAVFMLLVGFGAGTLFVGSWLHGQNPLQPPVPVMPRELTSFRDVVKRVLPAVVSIETRAKNAARPIQPGDPNPPRGVPSAPVDPERLGFGSGFFAHPSGVVVTNFHVVEGAETAVVHLLDGRKFTSKDIRIDRRTDVAVILLDAKDIRFAHLDFGDSDAMEIGDRVLAVGAPFGLTGSVTHGIVSAKGRNNLQMNMYEDFLQTDAAINPGNSGGPLVNLEGKVVGISAAIKSKSGGFQGVGLAVASNLVKNVIESLRTTGTVRRGYLGAHIRELNADVASRLGLPKEAGVIVAEVFPNTPAAKAKFQAGDIITGVADKTIKDGQAMQNVVASLPIDKPISFDLLRDGQRLRVNVTIEEQPAAYGNMGVPIPRNNLPFPNGTALATVGVDVAEFTDDLAEDLGYRKGLRGVLVTRVHDNSLALDAGLRRGMVVARIDQQNTPTLAAARAALQAADLTKGIVLQVASPQGGMNYVLVRQAR